MKLTDLTVASAILSKYAKICERHVVANSFPNGAPNHSSQSYLSVELNDYIDNPVSDVDAAMLRSLGWHPEQDGLYWVLG